MKQWREIKQEFFDNLQEQFGQPECKSQWRLLLESYLGDDIDHQFQLNKSSTTEQYQLFLSQLKRLKQNEPIQYVLGYAWFDDMKLKVNSSVLIPRQETEELVHWILQSHQFDKPIHILDVGTGSGAIALSLANYFTNATVHAYDISQDALTIAQQNAEKLEIQNVHFQKIDVLQVEDLPHQFDIVVSNPPYITKDFVRQMEAQVTDFEPHLALFVPNDDPLLFYRKIAELAQSKSQSSNVSTHLYFEINEFFVEETKQLLIDLGYTDVEARQDLNGNWRMVRAVKHDILNEYL